MASVMRAEMPQGDEDGHGDDTDDAEVRDPKNASRRAAFDRLIEMSEETDTELIEIEDFYQRIRGEV